MYRFGVFRRDLGDMLVRLVMILLVQHNTGMVLAICTEHGVEIIRV